MVSAPQFLLTALESRVSTELVGAARSSTSLAAVILPGAPYSCAPTTKPAPLDRQTWRFCGFLRLALKRGDAAFSNPRMILKSFVFPIQRDPERDRDGGVAKRPISFLCFCLLPERGPAVVVAVGMWESGVAGRIPKGSREQGKTCVWFSAVSSTPPFPQRFALVWISATESLVRRVTRSCRCATS
jgi:hypothetical protein